MPVILNCFAIAPYAAILGIFYFFLSGRVANMRRVDRLPTGHAKHARLERGVRAHGNFAEYTPFALLLILLAVLTGASALMAHILCAMLLAGRLLHAYGLLVAEPKRQSYLPRALGMVLTLSSILIASILLLWQWIGLSFS